MTMSVKTLDENIQVFMSMSEKLEADYPNKVVLFYDGKFRGSYDDINNAAIDAVKNFGKGPYLIRQVGAPTEMPMPASIAYKPYHAPSG